MRPQVRYVKSSDGTRLAVATRGEGWPLVIVPDGMSISIEGLWEIPEIRRNLERLAESRTLVQYDHRGVGLSSRDVEDFSLSAQAHDLEALVDGLDSPAVDLLAVSTSGPTAISFAANHPGVVRKLVLGSTMSRGRDLRLRPEVRDLRSLIEINWEFYLQTQSLALYGWTEVGRRWAERLNADVSKETYLKSFAAFRNSDVSELLPLVRCPTLVMHWRERGTSIETSRETAAAIPNARLMTFSQPRGITLSVDWESFFAHVVAFLDEDLETKDASELPGGTAIILFADIADSTALTERLGDTAFRAKARDLGVALRALIRECAGAPVEGPTLGDGVLAVFTSAREAIEAARRCGKAGDDMRLPLHLGLHAGDVTREKDPNGRDNVYGGAVNIASRISGLSAPGEVLVSDIVRGLARTSAGAQFEDRGEQALKGVGEPVRVWAVRE